MKNKKFSLAVIIPNYNNEKYIKKCLDSIIQQTLRPNEIIVVDDCSTDNSRKIIDEYVLKNDIVKALYLDKNGGVSNARNKGLEFAKSNYVTYIDSDDFYYNKDKLKNEMNLIKKYKAKGKDIVAYSKIVLVNHSGNLITNIHNSKLDKLKCLKGKSLVKLLSMPKSFCRIRDYCIKKDLLKKVGAYSFYKDFYEDLDLLMRIAESGTEYYCTYYYGTAYRQTENGLSKRPRSEHESTINEIVKNYYTKLCFKDKFKYHIVKIMYGIYEVFRKTCTKIIKR